MTPTTSRDLPGNRPRKDTERDEQEAIIKDADKTDGKDRDLVHGEGGTIDLPVKPGDGVLIIMARRFREQERNRADARVRLAAILRQAATPKAPRRTTKVPKASKRMRLGNKKHRAEIKRARAKPD